MRVQILPGGCRLDAGGTARAKKERVGGGLRGSIKGLSQAAAARLRWFLVSHFVPGYRCVAVTRTIHRAAMPEDWRSCYDRWCHAVKARNWGEAWRVELQRRRVPHAHSALWVPEDVSNEEIRDLWLQCTRESGDPEAVEYAVVFSPSAGNGAGWIAYLCAHMGKCKKVQLGWKGKQWGVINKQLFELVPSYDVELTERGAVWFARLLRRWARARYGCHVFTSARGFARAMDGAVLPALVRAALSFQGGEPF